MPPPPVTRFQCKVTRSPSPCMFLDLECRQRLSISRESSRCSFSAGNKLGKVSPNLKDIHRKLIGLKLRIAYPAIQSSGCPEKIATCCCVDRADAGDIIPKDITAGRWSSQELSVGNLEQAAR